MSEAPPDGNDGLPCPEVRRWAETKYRLIGLYDELFATGMKHKWDQRVYLDLYSGAGYSRIAGTNTYLNGSPLIALTVDAPFEKYIFCEERQELLDALKVRVQRIAPDANVAYVPGDCDAEIEKICAEIPKASSGQQGTQSVHGGPVRFRHQVRYHPPVIEILYGFSGAFGCRYGCWPQL